MPPTLKQIAGPFLMAAAWLALWLMPQRSLENYFICIFTAWIGLWLTWRASNQWSARTLVLALWIGAITLRVCGLLATPIFENDWARFLWDGWLTSTGHDPFQSVPMDWFDAKNVPVAMTRVLDHINHPQLNTVYGPVSQAGFALAAWIAPGSLPALKTVFILADLSLVALLQLRWGARRVLLYAWCPLIIQETSFSAHPDVLAIVFMVLAWNACDKPVRAGLFGALALAARPQAILLLPFLLWRGRWKSALAFAVTSLLLYLPFLMRGHAAEWSTLFQMGGDWHFNDILLSLLAPLIGEETGRRVCAGIFALVALGVFWRWSRRSPLATPPLAMVYAVWWLCSPVANAWYLQFAIPWLLAKRSRLAWAMVILAPLTYAHGLQLASTNAAWDLAWWVIPVEALVAAAVIAWSFIEWRRIVSQATLNDQ